MDAVTNASPSSSKDTYTVSLHAQDCAEALKVVKTPKNKTATSLTQRFVFVNFVSIMRSNLSYKKIKKMFTIHAKTASHDFIKKILCTNFVILCQRQFSL